MGDVIRLGTQNASNVVAGLRELARQIDSDEVDAASVVVTIMTEDGPLNFAIFGKCSMAEAVGACFMTAQQLGLKCIDDSDDEEDEDQ